MNHTYQLSCESTVDMPYSYITGRGISVLFYNYVIDGQVYEDNMARDPAATKWFYQQLEEGKLPSTSQINEFTYYEYFEQLLKKGNVLHLAFGSGMTPAVHNAKRAALRINEEQGKTCVIVVDTTCSSSGYGLFVDDCADRWDQGEKMDELAKWAEDNCRFMNHEFFSTDLKHFKRSGRMTGATATIATVLGICPLLHLNYDGKIVAYSKVRGKKNAIRAIVETALRRARGGADYDGKLFISHSQCLEDARATAALLKEKMPHLSDIRIFDIGTIIGSHSGAGTVAVYFWGQERDR